MGLIWLFLAPLLVAALMLSVLRQPPWRAGVATLVASLPGIVASLPSDVTPFEFFTEQTARGLWFAFSALIFILAGLFFHQVTDRPSAGSPGPRDVTTGQLGAAPASAPAAGPMSASSLFTVAYLVGGFMECVVGFGVSFVVVVSILRRAGIAPLPAILFGLFGHLFVPWGGLATGTTIGANLAQMPLGDLTLPSAYLVAPIAFLTLPLYWSCVKMVGTRMTLRDRLDDAVWLGLSLFCIAAAHAILPASLTGLVALGLVMVVRRLRDSMGVTTVSLRDDIKANIHYIVLCAVLITTHAVPVFRDTLSRLAVIAPFPDETVFQPFYHASIYLFGVGAAFAAREGRDLTALLAQTWQRAWRPILVTALFLTFGRWMSASGGAKTLADGLVLALGAPALALTPLIGGIAGFLTGSNIASNAAMMPIQTALDPSGHLPAGMLAALQNVSGSMMTAVSPIRISMARAMVDNEVTEHAIYEKAWPFAAISLLVTCLVATYFVFT